MTHEDINSINHASTSLTVASVNWKLRPLTLLAVMNAVHSNRKADGARVRDRAINTDNATTSVPYQYAD
jgi:hypothetical protein